MESIILCSVVWKSQMQADLAWRELLTKMTLASENSQFAFNSIANFVKIFIDNAHHKPHRMQNATHKLHNCWILSMTSSFECTYLISGN